jgi:hypothetical protein
MDERDALIHVLQERVHDLEAQNKTLTEDLNVAKALYETTIIPTCWEGPSLVSHYALSCMTYRSLPIFNPVVTIRKIKSDKYNPATNLLKEWLGITTDHPCCISIQLDLVDEGGPYIQVYERSFDIPVFIVYDGEYSQWLMSSKNARAVIKRLQEIYTLPIERY